MVDSGGLGESHNVDGPYVGHKKPTFEGGAPAERQMVTVLVRYGAVSVGRATKTSTMCLKLGVGGMTLEPATSVTLREL